MDFIPIIIAFASALIGVVGNTWDSNKTGIRKITLTGWMVVVLAGTSLAYGGIVIQQKNKEIIEIGKIRHIAHNQITDGVKYIVRHLTDGDLRERDSIKNTLETLKTIDYQRKIGKTRLVTFQGMGGVVSDGPLGGFENTYELFDANINNGKNLLDDVLIKYAQFLKPETIIKINKLLHNNFFVSKYTFTRNKTYFEEGLNDEVNGAKKSPWNYLGLYYFNAVYWGNGQRPGNNEDFNDFISSIESLTMQIKSSCFECAKQP